MAGGRASLCQIQGRARRPEGCSAPRNRCWRSCCILLTGPQPLWLCQTLVRTGRGSEAHKRGGHTEQPSACGRKAPLPHKVKKKTKKCLFK